MTFLVLLSLFLVYMLLGFAFLSFVLFLNLKLKVYEVTEPKSTTLRDPDIFLTCLAIWPGVLFFYIFHVAIILATYPINGFERFVHRWIKCIKEAAK